MTKLDSVEQYKECEHCQLPIKSRGEMVTVSERTENNIRVRYYHRKCFAKYCAEASDE